MTACASFGSFYGERSEEEVSIAADFLGEQRQQKSVKSLNSSVVKYLASVLSSDKYIKAFRPYFDYKWMHYRASR